MLRRIRQRFGAILGVAAIASLLALGVASERDPSHESTAVLAIGASDLVSDEEVVRASVALAEGHAAATLAEIAIGASVRVTVQEQLGLGDARLRGYRVTADAAPDADVVTITATGPDAVNTSRYATATAVVAASAFEDVYAPFQVQAVTVPDDAASSVRPPPLEDAAIAGVAVAALAVAAAVARPVHRPRSAPSPEHPPMSEIATDAARTDTVAAGFESPRWPILVGLGVALVFSHLGAESALGFPLHVQAAGIALLGVLALASALELGGRLTIPAALLAVVAFTAVGLASVLWADDRDAAIAGFESLVKGASVAVLVGLVVRSAATLRAAVIGTVVAGTTIGLAAIAQSLLDLELRGITSGRIEALPSGDVLRTAGPVGDPNFFGQLLVVTAALAVGVAFGARTRRGRLAAWAAAAVAGGAVLTTWSRGGAVALAIVAIVAAVRAAGRTALVTLAGVGMVALLAAPGTYTDRLSAAFDVSEPAASPDTAIRGRISELRVGAELFADHPVLGVGIGNYENNYLEEATDVGLDTRREARSAHNAVIEVAAELGLVGLAAWLGVVAVAAGSLVRARRLAGDAGSATTVGIVDGLLLAVAAHLVTSLFLHSSYPRSFWLLVGLAAVSPLGVEASSHRQRVSGGDPAGTVGAGAGAGTATR